MRVTLLPRNEDVTGTLIDRLHAYIREVYRITKRQLSRPANALAGLIGSF